MDMQQSDIQNRAYITTRLVLSKAAQRMTGNPFDLKKGERNICQEQSQWIRLHIVVNLS